MLKSFRFAIVPVTVAGLACWGCATSTSTSSTSTAVADTEPSTTDAAATNPVESAKQARWRAATRGLTFDTGRVVVDARSRRNENASREAYEAGLVDFGRNDFVGAVGHYRDALINDPDFIDGYLSLGDALHMKGEAAWAVAAFRTVLDERDQDADARFKLAMELWGMSEAEEAIDQMTRVVEIDPARPDAHERLAIWHYYAGDYAAAWREVHATRALGSDVPPQLIPLLSGQMADPGANAN